MTDWCVRRAKQRQRNICYTSRLLTQCEMAGNTQKSILWSTSDMLNHVIRSSTFIYKEWKSCHFNWQTNIPYFQVNFPFLLDRYYQTNEHFRFFLFFPLQNKGEQKKKKRKKISFKFFFPASLERYVFIQEIKIYFHETHL